VARFSRAVSGQPKSVALDVKVSASFDPWEKVIVSGPGRAGMGALPEAGAMGDSNPTEAAKSSCTHPLITVLAKQDSISRIALHYAQKPKSKLIRKS